MNDTDSCVILIPAHNEELGIESTLTSLQPELGINDSILVIADNCTDNTAEIVRSFVNKISQPRQELNQSFSESDQAKQLNSEENRAAQFTNISDSDLTHHLLRNSPVNPVSSDSLVGKEILEKNSDWNKIFAQPSNNINVIERNDPTNRGKGFALHHGLKALEMKPPEIVVILDADCELRTGSLQALKQAVKRSQKPAQAIYLLKGSTNPTFKQQLSNFAFLFKNWVRPLGLYQLGVPCLLTGTGMAFPWQTLRGVNLASAEIVEDMKLGIDLACQGNPVQLCPEALVQSEVAPTNQSTLVQRTRWEHGHVQLIFSQVPKVIKAAIQKKSWRLFAFALELAVPPLSLLLGLWAMSFVLNLSLLFISPAFSGLPIITGTSAGTSYSWSEHSKNWLILTPLLTNVLCLMLLVLSLAIAWYRYARKTLPLSILLLAPLYVFWKLPIYGKLLLAREKKWIRTERV